MSLQWPSGPISACTVAPPALIGMKKIPIIALIGATAKASRFPKSTT